MARRDAGGPSVHCKCNQCGHRQRLSGDEVRAGMLCPGCYQRPLRPVRRTGASPVSLSAEMALGNVVIVLGFIALTGGFGVACGGRAFGLPVSLRVLGLLISAATAVGFAAWVIARNARSDRRDNLDAAANERAERRRRD